MIFSVIAELRWSVLVLTNNCYGMQVTPDHRCVIDVSGTGLLRNIPDGQRLRRSPAMPATNPPDRVYR
jgi:hypothetical protein